MQAPLKCWYISTKLHGSYFIWPILLVASYQLPHHTELGQLTGQLKTDLLQKACCVLAGKTLVSNRNGNDTSISQLLQNVHKYQSYKTCQSQTQVKVSLRVCSTDENTLQICGRVSSNKFHSEHKDSTQQQAVCWLPLCKSVCVVSSNVGQTH